MELQQSIASSGETGEEQSAVQAVTVKARIVRSIELIKRIS
jgi:hypothetical protein